MIFPGEDTKSKNVNKITCNEAENGLFALLCQASVSPIIGQSEYKKVITD